MDLKLSNNAIEIIVPVYRDAAVLVQFLTAGTHQKLRKDMIVSLGEEDPEAIAICQNHDVRFTVADSPGRAQQMNTGAALARADILLFLHVDTMLPEEAVEQICAAIQGGAVGGAFKRRFDRGGLFLKLTCWLADWRGRIWGWFLGDQAMFVRRDIFEQLGGFPLIKPFEDLEFSRKLKRAGKTVLITDTALSSARRFQRRGAVRQTCCDFVLTLRYFFKSGGNSYR